MRNKWLAGNLVLAITTLLAACGGSSSSSSSTSTTPAITSVSGNALFVPNDTLFADQWHLKNTGQNGALAGEELNVQKVWTSFKGTGIRIAVVDDGLDLLHEDLTNSVKADSWDYSIGAVPVSNLDTGGGSAASHGTSCAGLAAAKGNNNLGVTGVAFNASLVGYNLIAGSNHTGANEADSMTRGVTTNQISSNSWGAADGTGTLSAANAAWVSAIGTGHSTGRGGKGIIYVWAAGNGYPNDRSDFDGQSNDPSVITVAALTDKGAKASYSEPGSNVFVSAYGGEFCTTQTMTTTDITGAAGSNTATTAGVSDLANQNYTKCFNGTSSATPEISGVVALMLEANPNLTWRDVRVILAQTARKNDATDSGWGVNGAQLNINDKYGFGTANAEAAVNAALTWTSLPVMKPVVSLTATPAVAISDGSAGGTTAAPAYGAATTSVINVASSNITKIEYVKVTVTSAHSEFGDLKITLTAPSGTVSTFALPHNCSDTNNGTTTPCTALLSNGFTFSTVRDMNESADGDWTLSIQDGVPGNTGTLASWSLQVAGR